MIPVAYLFPIKLIFMTAIYNPSKNRYLKPLWLLVIMMFLYVCLHAQATKPGIPPFRIALTDKTIFSKTNIKADKPLILVYFDPDCDHCRDFTKQLTGNIDRFKNAQIVMISYQPLDMLRQFETNYQLKKFSNIKVGTEGYTLVVQQFYNISRFPFVALYNKKGTVINTYALAPAIDELAGKVKKQG